MKRVYLIPNRCLGCEECIEACAKEHDWEARNYVLWIDMVYQVQLRCAHCENAPCMLVCPVDAIKKSEEGIVTIDEGVCIACGNCALVCPFGIPRFSAESKKMIKCDQCIDRQRKGEEPVCVRNCPTMALQFGEIEEYEEEKRKRTARRVLQAGTYLRDILMPQEG